MESLLAAWLLPEDMLKTHLQWLHNSVFPLICFQKANSYYSDEDIYRTIARGVRGPAMLPWFSLGKEEKRAVTYYIKTFNERFTEEDPEAPVVTPGISASHSTLAIWGQQLYKEAKCFGGHGKEGRGDGRKADELKDGWGYPIRPRDFTSESFKRGSGIKDIFLKVATELDGPPMASHGDSMPDRDILSLASYVKSLSRERPGYLRGVMGMIPMTRDERVGMMTYLHSGMNGGMMGCRMMR